MDIRQLREWGKRLFDSVGANTKKAIAGVISAAMIVTVALVAIPAQADDTMIADPTTFTQWEQGIGDPADPRSTGRVWTDKSVSTQEVTLKTYNNERVTVKPEDGSFLVGLSAMSSAQKLIGVSNVTKPLDIVLVLDTSGSMDEDMTTYSPVYAGQLDTNTSYYIANGNSYRAVRWNNDRTSWGYGWLNWTSVTPTTAADDTAAGHVQFYTRTTASRMSALKQAANGFINQTIESNAKVSDPNKKNRIGLVTYASNANRQSGLTDSLSGLKTKVNDLSAGGTTRADLGLQEAGNVLGKARADASKVVIFFTDGAPGGNEQTAPFATVAPAAVTKALSIKNSGASVYSIGIFTGADAKADVSTVTEATGSGALRSNAFMQAVSSNYPNATNWYYSAFGQRAVDANYYLAASDADTLNAVFDSIWNEVSSNPTSPIQSTTQGGTTESQGNGVVTFTDQLGDYMRVTKMNSIVFAGTKHETVSSQTSADGSETRYTFEGSVTANEIYQAADLSTMQIVVKHNTGKTGDLVTVNVPAELLPLRLYTANVDKDGNVTTSINRTNPMRLFYEVALKEGTIAKVAQPDEAMSKYIEGNTDADGNVRFYTNAYNKATDGANGSTTAVFTPATTNDFYYFTQDTPLYNSKDLNDPAKSIDARGTYYYQRTFYANNAKHEQWIDVLGKNAVGKAVADADENYYAPAGTTRTGLSRLYTAAKTDNATGTATNAIAPDWVTNNVTVRLGNNGLHKIPLPGALMVTEHVVWPEGATPDPDKEFPFRLELPEPAGARAAASYRATIAGQNVTVQNGSTFSLKDGETAAVYGLPAGMRAKAVQTDYGGPGWTVNHAEDMGDIKRNETTQLGFANTYALKPTTLDAGSIKGSKTLTGRDWQPDESFTFHLAAGDANPTAPMPDPATVTVTNPGGANAYKNGQTIPFEFGAIEYRAPGTYQYVVTEKAGSKPGMSYSGARYIVTVTVTDNRDGTMSASVKLEPDAESADFTNTFLGKNDAVATIRGIKHYTDHTGTNGNGTVGKFNVEITADERNPAHGPTFTGPVTVPVGIDGTWPYELKFTNSALNGKDSETFTYHVREVVPAGVDASNPMKDGMTYDVNTYDVKITVSRDDQQNLITEVAYPGNGERVELTNSYRAANTEPQPLTVTKTVTGRDAEAGKFTFNATLSAGDAKNVRIKQADGSLADWTDHAVKTPKIEKNGSADIDFGQLVFTMPGTYTFQVSEQLPEGVTTGNPKKDGWTYDAHTHTVTYTVTDDNGKLQAAVNTTGSETFSNAYTASTQYQGMMQIGKRLTGRSMTPGEFGFIIEPQNGAPMPGGAAQATTANPFSAVSGQELVWPVNTTLLAGLQFTQNDAGKTYKYTISEQKPEGVTADNQKKNGVTYDFTEHTASIKVIDNGNGTLSTKTWIDDDETNTVARFKNTYEAAAGKQSFELTKTVNGRDWKDDESFTFDLTPNEGQSSVSKDVLAKAMPEQTSKTVSKPNGNTAQFDFGEFTFSQAGTYVYNVTEQQGGTTDKGLTYDGRTAVVSFTVVDNGLGQYVAGKPLITGIGEANTFTNAYEAQSFDGVPDGMEFSKQLTGIAWPADRQFTFTLTGANGAPMPEGTKDGVVTQSVGKPDEGDTAKFNFGAITYTETGTYTYTVKELNGVMPGVAFDDHEAKVTVKVEDDKQGHLVATATVDKAAFVNKYTANEVNGVPANMEFSKQLTGTEWADRTFTFTLTGVDGAPMPAEATVTVGKPESGDTSTFKFGAIKYSKAGTYKYTVTEHNDGMGGIAYDDHTANVTVEVKDNGRGQLIAEATVENGKFTNAYSSAAFDGVPTGMLFSKQLTGIDWPTDRAFEFTLEGVDGAPMPAEAKVSVGKPADGDTASFNFGNIRYEQPGTYAYTVKETGGDMPGVTNDTHVANVTVEVKDNGNGQLEATATVTGGAFVNTYGAQPSDGVPEGMTFIKQLNGTAWPADRQFEFTLTGEGNAPMPQGAKDGKLNVTVGKPAGNGGTQTFDFGKIVYDAEGVYKYTVTEVKGDMPGVTYATNTATVTVTVTDDKAGKLVAKAEVTGGVFTNTYTANAFEGVPTNMEFSKQLTGVAWPEGRDFEFTLEGVNGAPMPADAKAKATKPANGDTAAFTFGAIRYDKVGTYEYAVRETKGDMPGVAYDGHAAKVTVTVSDNGKGQLEAKAEVAEGVFVNRYAAAPFEGVPTGMKLTKQLTGIAWPADRTFEFAIAAAEGTPMPAQTKISVGKPAAGDTASFDFGSIRYDKAGTYEYTVKEMRGTMPGVAYDGHTATITVTVTDNGTGNLQAEAKVSESQFVNKYSAQPATGVPTDFTLYKRVDGMAWNENQQFEFTIQGQDGAPMPENGTVTVGKPAEGDSASFDFGEIVYTRSGVYRYTVTEIAGNQPGMAYDGHTATITVDVVDDGQGHLVAATTVENGLFTNKYATQNVAYPGINVTEDLTGRAQAQGEFGFTVSGSDEDMQRAGYKPQARAVSGVYEFHAAASGETVTVPGLFTGLELTHDDIRSGRKFNYEIDQIGAQSGNGLTVDEQVYAVQIWATDNGDGTMRVHTSVNGTETSEKTPVLPFHNVYATAPVTIGGDAQVRINAHKTLHGRDLVNGEFHFAVRDAKDAQLSAGTNAADGTVRFDAIEFTDARLNADVKAGIATAHTTGKQTVYRYATTVAEITDSLPSGVTALESGFTVTLVITDNGDGQLQASVEYPADANGTLNFVNQYGAASEVSLGMNGNKVLAMASGDNAPDITGKYTFTLSGSEGAPMPEKTQVTNDASGAVDFGEIKFTVANVFGESAADKPEEKPADKNTDETAGEIGGESAEESAESEESTETEGAKDAKETETDAETKDEPTKREKTFTYTVSESGTVAGVTNDAAAQRTIDVHVVDNGDGTLTVSRQSDAAGTAFTFTNTYGVQPVGPVSPTDPNVAGSVPLTKTLNGRDLRAGEFTFELVEASGEGRVVGTAANAADGTVNLPGVTFDKPGNYAYLVREVAGNAGGVSYDNRTYVAVAQVTDAGDGTLAVTWQITDPTGAAVQSMTFTNEYAAEPTSVQFSVGKMLDGRDLVANEFSFALRGADGDTPMPAGSVNGVQTMANDAEGNVQFGAIGYTKPGDYLYTVSEVKGDAEGVTYDETEYAVTVHVTDDGEGSLQADLQYADGAEGIVFRNTYVTPQEPTKPKPEEPAKPTPTPSQPSTPATPSAPTTPSAPSRPNAPSYSSGSHSTYTTYVGSMASTGSSIAIIVAVFAALVIAGAGLLLARKRGMQD